jgi:hypothetical protein
LRFAFCLDKTNRPCNLPYGKCIGDQFNGFLTKNDNRSNDCTEKQQSGSAVPVYIKLNPLQARTESSVTVSYYMDSTDTVWLYVHADACGRYNQTKYGLVMGSGGKVEK